MHMQLLIARTLGVEREINYERTYNVKFMRWMLGSIKIINFLDQLIQRLTWADRCHGLIPWRLLLYNH